MIALILLGVLATATAYQHPVGGYYNIYGVNPVRENTDYVQYSVPYYGYSHSYTGAKGYPYTSTGYYSEYPYGLQSHYTYPYYGGVYVKEGYESPFYNTYKSSQGTGYGVGEKHGMQGIGSVYSTGTGFGVTPYGYPYYGVKGIFREYGVGHHGTTGVGHQTTFGVGHQTTSGVGHQGFGAGHQGFGVYGVGYSTPIYQVYGLKDSVQPKKVVDYFLTGK